MIALESMDGKGMCRLSTRIELRADEVIEGEDVKECKDEGGWEVLKGRNFVTTFYRATTLLPYQSLLQVLSILGIISYFLNFACNATPIVRQQSESKSTSRKPRTCTSSITALSFIRPNIPTSHFGPQLAVAKGHLFDERGKNMLEGWNT